MNGNYLPEPCACGGVTTAARDRSPWGGLGALAFLAVVTAALLLSAAPANAGQDRDRGRGHGDSRSNFSFSIRVGDCDRGGSIRYEHRGGRDHRGDRGWANEHRPVRVVRPAPVYRPAPRCDSGYDKPVDRYGGYRRVYVPPVYSYRYDSCGNAIRVCVRAGYWKQVYFSGSGHERW